MARPKKVHAEQLKETIDTFLEAIVEKFGDNVLSNLRGDKIEAMTSGSLSLDASIGIGGFPKGRFTEIAGAEGTGKTTLALTTATKEIENGGRVLYIDTENMLSYYTIEQMLGKTVDQGKLVLLQPELAEQALMIAEKGITSGEFTLIVIDTVAALAPQEEKEKEFDEFTMGQLPRLMAKFFRRDASDVKVANVAVLLLNQVRDKIGSYMGGYETPGGHAIKHYASVRVFLTKGTEIKQGEDKIGINSRFVIKKNKMGPPFRSFEIPIIFGKGVDYYTDAVSFCETLGILKKSGAFYKFEGETIGQGRNNTAQFLRDNPETLDKLEKLLYNQINKESSKAILVEESEEESVE
jgi:recombination protein RecA